MSSDRKSFMILNFSLFEDFLSHSKESSDFVCPSVNTSSSLVNSTLLSTGNDVIDVDKWDPPKIAGIPVYIWPYIIVGLWHFLTATGEALFSVRRIVALINVLACMQILVGASFLHGSSFILTFVP